VHVGDPQLAAKFARAKWSREGERANWRRLGYDLAMTGHAMTCAMFGRLSLIGFLLCWVSTACSTTATSLKARYAKERRCSETQVTVREEGGAVYRVHGCGDDTQYICESFAGPGDPSKHCREWAMNPHEPSGNPPPKNPRQDLVAPR
jgi:hypothetical protein